MKKFIALVVLECCLVGCMTYDTIRGYSDNKVDKITSLITNDCIRYRLYFPTDLTQENMLKYGKLPVLIYLHDKNEGPFVGLDKIMSYVHDGNVPAMVVAPICPDGTDWTNGRVIIALNRVLSPLISQDYLIDTNRVYMTGFGSGGQGAWSYARTYPTQLTTVAPVCGGVSPMRTTPKIIVTDEVRDLNIWAVDYVDDRLATTDMSKMIMSQLWAKNVGLARYSMLLHGGHTDAIYSDPIFLGWIFGTRRSK